MKAFIGQKQIQSQAFLEDGTRIPVTKILTPSLPVVWIKTMEKDGYNALQFGLGIGHKREIRLSDVDAEKSIGVGTQIKITDVLKPGDIVDAMGISKGKGFAGVVKRYHFKGGPRTHGQSDRERAPGSIGQTTTPGRVYKGKRMAGRMGQDRVTVKNLEVVDVTEGEVLVKGLIPGRRDSIVYIEKVGENKKFVPLYKEEVKDAK